MANVQDTAGAAPDIPYAQLPGNENEANTMVIQIGYQHNHHPVQQNDAWMNAGLSLSAMEVHSLSTEITRLHSENEPGAPFRSIDNISIASTTTNKGPCCSCIIL